MDAPNNDSVNSKEKNGFFSHSINGILGLSSDTVLTKTRNCCGENTAQDQEAMEEGNYTTFEY